jgi:hypothetical protein
MELKHVQEKHSLIIKKKNEFYLDWIPRLFVSTRVVVNRLLKKIDGKRVQGEPVY